MSGLQDESQTLSVMQVKVLTSELPHHLLRNTVLEVYLAVDITRVTSCVCLRLRAPCRDAEAWRIKSRLGSITAKNVKQDLDMTLWLWGDIGEYQSGEFAPGTPLTCMKPPMTP